MPKSAGSSRRASESVTTMAIASWTIDDPIPQRVPSRPVAARPTVGRRAPSGLLDPGPWSVTGVAQRSRGAAGVEQLGVHPGGDGPKAGDGLGAVDAEPGDAQRILPGLGQGVVEQPGGLV